MTVDDHSPSPGEQAMLRLARQFPSLADAPLEKWEPLALEDWARGPVTVQALYAARFVLSLWNPRRPSWRFDVHEAFEAFDHEHRNLVARWAMAPWYPSF